MADQPPVRHYCGRFAPSPSGELHAGSLVAALASYLDARLAGGSWLLRIEDIDRARSLPAASASIMRTLDALGFAWDAPPLVQSQRTARYRAALDRLCSQGDVYPCACSRRDIAAARPADDGERIYPGTCRPGPRAARRSYAMRLRVPDQEIGFIDRIQGRFAQNLARQVGDFVVQRADGEFAYQLAVVVDDADSRISDVVRGADLLTSTPRQIWLQQRLGLPTPRYAHLPLLCNAQGEKLSKQTRAPALDPDQPAAALCAALRFLGQNPPADLPRAPLPEVWRWAQANWRLENVAPAGQRPADAEADT